MKAFTAAGLPLSGDSLTYSMLQGYFVLRCKICQLGFGLALDLFNHIKQIYFEMTHTKVLHCLLWIILFFTLFNTHTFFECFERHTVKMNVRCWRN